MYFPVSNLCKRQVIMLINYEQAKNFIQDIFFAMKNISSIQEILNYIHPLQESLACSIKQASLSNLPIGWIDLDVWQYLINKKPQEMKLGRKILLLEFSNKNSILFTEHCFVDSNSNTIQVQIDFDEHKQSLRLVKKFELFMHHLDEMQTFNNMAVELANDFVNKSIFSLKDYSDISNKEK